MALFRRYLQLRDGYLFEKQKREEAKRNPSLQFEKELHDLLNRTKSIKSPINAATLDTDINEYNRPSEEWINDVEILYNKYLKKHFLSQRIKEILCKRDLDTYSDLIACLKSISKDQSFINELNNNMETSLSNYETGGKRIAEFDVFLSHANQDKSEFVDELNASLECLGINIFYDKNSIEWGDIWKNRILEGVSKAEFAIIVVSENFFDREWTEKELNEFLSRQNKNGQKLILPILHNITNEELRDKYPLLAQIQTIDSNTNTCDKIAILFARQLIKRLKNTQ